jgi:hypothetical protein
MTSLAPLLIAQLAFAQAPIAAARPADAPLLVASAAESPRQEHQDKTEAPAAAETPRGENPSHEEPPPEVVNETLPANAASPAEAPSTATTETDGYTKAANAVMVKDKSWRKVPRPAFYAVAVAAVGLLVFSAVMDGVAGSSRTVAATSSSTVDVINAQNNAAWQTNAANTGYVITAVLAIGIAVLAGFTNWVD